MNTSIYGNNFLISIAFTAETPTQAAKVAQHYGFTRSQIRAVRNASKLLRDEGEDAFNVAFAPWELVDVEPDLCKTMTLKLQLRKTQESRPLNVTEFNEIASIIKSVISKYGVDVKIDKKKPNPYAKSKLYKKK